METYTVAFFGHRDFAAHEVCREQLENLLRDLLREKEYVEFLVGRNGEFDRYVSSVITHMKKTFRHDNSAHILFLHKYTAELKNSEAYFKQYYDEIELSQSAQSAHYKAAITMRNREMAERADLIICYIEASSGGAYQAVHYGEKLGKPIINLKQ